MNVPYNELMAGQRKQTRICQSEERARPDYVSYLLRMWRDVDSEESMSEKDKAAWRASVVGTLSGKRRGFATLEDLFDFLRNLGDAERSRRGDATLTQRR